ncbi:hypothetical protein BD779DRAFT_1675476 [Infundibulicybe gibba]|nr:hypothetical protein BD779DRAFT_1675476 [Infundibulicybe gibba]
MTASTTDEFSAWVSIDGVRLPQYGVETTVIKGVKTVSCWIASEVDKMLGGTSTYSANLIPDTATRSAKHVSDTVARPLMFSKTEFTDEDAYMNSNPHNLGEIVVEIWTTEIEPELHTTVHDYSPKEQPTKIHERTKKAISHRATFGDEFATVHRKASTCTDGRRVMNFIFKYRPREYLQAEGIMPLDPKPAARLHKRAASALELSTSEDEETGIQLRNEEVRLRQEELRVQKESLEVQKREARIRKEELRIQAEELKIQLDAVKAKSQRKKAKLESLEAKLQVKTEIIDLT